MKKLKRFVPLLVEEVIHYLLWSGIIRSVPDRFDGSLGTVVIVSLAAAILLSNLFDVVFDCGMIKRSDGDKAGQRISQPMRYLVLSIIFIVAFLYITQYAPARIVLPIGLGFSYALLHVAASHVILRLLQSKEGITAEDE